MRNKTDAYKVYHLKVKMRKDGDDENENCDENYQHDDVLVKKKKKK